VFGSESFPMMMWEGERSKKKHQNKKYQLTRKTQKDRKYQGNTKENFPQWSHQFSVVVKFPLRTGETPLGSRPLFDPR
jgi:hypothetical protein